MVARRRFLCHFPPVASRYSSSVPVVSTIGEVMSGSTMLNRPDARAAAASAVIASSPSGRRLDLHQVVALGCRRLGEQAGRLRSRASGRTTQLSSLAIASRRPLRSQSGSIPRSSEPFHTVQTRSSRSAR